jgi:cytochrome P450
MIRDTIQARQKHIKSANDNATDDLPNDLLTGLLQSETPIEEEYLIGNMKVFLYGGFNSTAATITWALHYLATFPEYQDRLCKEVELLFKDGNHQPTLKELQGCTFLNCILKETLRLKAPTNITRRALRDITIGSSQGNNLQYDIPKGCMLFVFPLCAHSLQGGEDAGVFNPDRDFSCLQMQHFSMGQRNCVGQGLAMAEMRAAVASIVYNYKLVNMEGRDPPKLVINLNFNPHNVYIRAKRRR